MMAADWTAVTRPTLYRVAMAGIHDRPHVELFDPAEWRAWLEANHSTSRGVWLVTRRRGAGGARVDYEAAVREALCFGWVDGQAATVDPERAKQYFAPRRTGSPWAATNKARIEQLTVDGRMAPAGLAVVERAKADGSWSLLDSVERLEVPPDFAAALEAEAPARAKFDSFPPSARKQILTWIALTKRPDTRTKRIKKAAAEARLGRRANDPAGR